MTAAEYAGYVLMAGAALTAWVFIAIMLAGCLRAWLKRRDDTARGWLAQRGYRMEGGVLWRMRHEDDEGWWTGRPLGKVRSHVAGRRLVERLQARHLIDRMTINQYRAVQGLDRIPARIEPDDEPADPAEPLYPFDAEWLNECRKETS